MVGAGGRIRGALDIWNVGWLDQDARDVFGVFDDGAFWQGERVEARLGAVEAAPGEAAPRCGDGDGVVGAAGDVRDGVFVW